MGALRVRWTETRTVIAKEAIRTKPFCIDGKIVRFTTGARLLGMTECRGPVGASLFPEWRFVQLCTRVRSTRNAYDLLDGISSARDFSGVRAVDTCE